MKYKHIVIAAAISASLSGCALLPMSMQPKDSGSRTAEGIWEVIDSVDTAQTAKFVRSENCHEGDPVARMLYGGGNPTPARVVATNAAIMALHSYVSAYLDDKVSEADPGDSTWYVIRLMWHVGSLSYSTASVVNNTQITCHYK